MRAKLVVPIALYNKIMFFVDNIHLEVSGFGKIVFRNGDAIVTNVYLLEQEVSSAATDIDEKSLGKLMFESRADEGMLNLWWHSHVNMPAFFSGTDDATIKEIGAKGFCIALVVNKKREWKIVYHAAGSDVTPMLWQEMDLVIDYGTQAMEQAWKAEMDAKVKVKTYSYANDLHSRVSLINDPIDNDQIGHRLDNNWDDSWDKRNCVWNKHRQRFTDPQLLGEDERKASEASSHFVQEDIEVMKKWSNEEWLNLFEAEMGRKPKKGELKTYKKEYEQWLTQN